MDAARVDEARRGLLAFGGIAALISAVRTAWPATRPAHSFFELATYPLNVLPSGFRFLDGYNPTDPLIARQRRDVLPLGACHRVGDENFS